MDAALQNKDIMNGYFNKLGYTLLDKIGEGGFSSVYKAIHILTKQFVAIKILHINSLQTTTQQHKRFEREIMLCAQLQHPNIINLLDQGEVGNQLFAVFPYIDGITLKQRLFSNGALSPIESINIMMQILKALIHAHDQGVIHRDIKPANIMLTKTGTITQAIMLDFGISTLTEPYRNQEFINLTLTQESLGSPSYAAPEQLRGDTCTTKTDIYLWGLTLVECLTGQPLISESSVASICHKQLDSAPHILPPSIAQHPLANLLRCVLHKNPQQRLDNTRDIYQRLNQLDFSTLMSDVNNVSLNKSSPHIDRTLITSHSLMNHNIAEKKQITVMCIRINNNHQNFLHSIDNNDDLELYEQLFQQHKEQCLCIAQRYGATHVNSIGDTLLCYFGYPNVTDDDCRLSVKAALKIIDWKSNHNADESSSLFNNTLHIGIHSGMVVVQQASINDGESTNIAMTLARQAKVNQVLCSDTTRQILQCHYDCEVYVADKAAADNTINKTYLIKSDRRSESSRISRNKARLSAFCIRPNMLKTLKDSLISNTNQHSVHVYGEAGMGKSWLVANLYLYCCRPPTSLKYQLSPLMVRCRSEEKHSCLRPIVELLNQRHKLNKLNIEQRIKRLSNLLTYQDSKPSESTLSLLFSWLGYTPVANVKKISLDTCNTTKNLVFDALNLLLCQPNTQQDTAKTIYIMEDIHNSDPISLDYIYYLVTSPQFSLQGHCFCSTSRSPLVEKMNASSIKQIALEKLNEQQTQHLLSHIFNQKNVHKDVKQIICDLGEGNPWYIHELADTLKRKKQIHMLDGEIQFNSSNHKIDVPCSLRDQLQQKLDKLTSSKSIAQIASAMGYEFDVNFLSLSSGQDKTTLQHELDELVQSNIICSTRKSGHELFYFKQKLLRETIFSSMPQKIKQETLLKITKQQNPVIVN